MSKNERFRERAYGILKAMKGGKKAQGFTMVETLIVLAVTGALFAAVAVTLSGRQARTQFTQAVQEVESQISQIIGDVGVGYYPDSTKFTCSAALTGPAITAGSTEQGANKGCIFLGKAIQFNVGNKTDQEFKVHTIAGLQRNTAGEEVTSYSEAKPKAVSPPGAPDASVTEPLLYGLSISKATYGNSDTPVGTIAFVNSLASYSSGSIVSGSQQVKVIPVRGSNLGQSQEQGATAINNELATSDVDPEGGIKLCFVSGASDQSGLITIGSKGRQLSVTLSIKGNRTCS